MPARLVLFLSYFFFAFRNGIRVAAAGPLHSLVDGSSNENSTCVTAFTYIASPLYKTQDLRATLRMKTVTPNFGCPLVPPQGIWSILAVMLFAGAGFLGVSCVAALTKRFGALHSAITTTARKAVTLLLSFLVFPDKPFSVQHGVGAAVFILGLVVSETGIAHP